MQGDLTTLNNVKAWLNLTVSTSDALLTRLISAVSAWVQTYIGRQIASQNYTEVRNGSGGEQLFFANYPVTAVSAVTVDGVAIPPQPSFGQAGYSFTGKLLTLTGYKFNRGLANVALTYTAGYAATPLDLEQATIELIALAFKERAHIGEDSAVFQGQTVTFSKIVPPHTKDVLDKWRRVAPVA